MSFGIAMVPLALSAVVTALATDADPARPPEILAENHDGAIRVIGVQHAPGQLRSNRLSPAHVRAALQLTDPDVVCVESDPSWLARGRFYRQTYEAEHVAVPWAAEREIPLYGVDWIGDTAGHFAERERIGRCRLQRDRLGSAPPDPREYAYGAARLDQLRVVSRQAGPDFVRLNGQAYGRSRIEWLDSKRAEPGSAQAYIAERDWHIAEHVAAVATSYPEASVAVVIGAAHKANLERELRARGFTVQPLPRPREPLDFADGAAMDLLLAGRDVAAILQLATDAPDGVTIPPERSASLRSRLSRIAQESPGSTLSIWHDYLAAREAMLRGELEAGAASFGRLVETGQEVAFPYRGNAWRNHLTVAQASRLELGRIADLQARREDAAREYRALLDTIRLPDYSEDYHSVYEFLATAANAVRALIEHGYTHDLAWRATGGSAVLPASSGPRGDETARTIQRGWDALRQRRWGELRRTLQQLSDCSEMAAWQCLELRYFRTALAVYTDTPEQAQTLLDELGRIAAGLPRAHWLRRELPRLASQLERRCD